MKFSHNSAPIPFPGFFCPRPSSNQASFYVYLANRISRFIIFFFFFLFFVKEYKCFPLNDPRRKKKRRKRFKWRRWVVIVYFLLELYFSIINRKKKMFFSYTAFLFFYPFLFFFIRNKYKGFEKFQKSLLIQMSDFCKILNSFLN